MHLLLLSLSLLIWDQGRRPTHQTSVALMSVTGHRYCMWHIRTNLCSRAPGDSASTQWIPWEAVKKKLSWHVDGWIRRVYVRKGLLCPLTMVMASQRNGLFNYMSYPIHPPSGSDLLPKYLRKCSSLIDPEGTNPITLSYGNQAPSSKYTAYIRQMLYDQHIQQRLYKRHKVIIQNVIMNMVISLNKKLLRWASRWHSGTKTRFFTVTWLQ